MSLPLTARKFKPTLFATVLTLLGVALFVRLGLWQLDRAAEKRQLEAQYAAGRQSQVELTPANAGTLPRYQRVRASGRYDPQHQFLLDNMPSAMGQPGYRVVTPFQLHSGNWILVDRGWRALGATRADLPGIGVSAAPRNIAGQLDALPRPGVRLAAAPPAPAASWPRVLSFPQHADFEQALGHPLYEGLVLLDPDQTDGYERLWQMRFDLQPQRHIGYAVQWFAFAVTALVIYGVLGLRRGRTKRV